MNDYLTPENPEASDVALDVLNEGTVAETVASPVEGSGEESQREVTRVFQQEPLDNIPVVM